VALTWQVAVPDIAIGMRFVIAPYEADYVFFTNPTATAAVSGRQWVGGANDLSFAPFFVVRITYRVGPLPVIVDCPTRVGGDTNRRQLTTRVVAHGLSNDI